MYSQPATQAQINTLVSLLRQLDPAKSREMIFADLRDIFPVRPNRAEASTAIQTMIEMVNAGRVSVDRLPASQSVRPASGSAHMTPAERRNLRHGNIVPARLYTLEEVPNRF